LDFVTVLDGGTPTMADENRKLAAIMSADVVGYSKLMADDEATTVKILQDYRAAIAGVVERHKGRVVNAPGDNILADFPSAVEAVECASEIQQVLKGRNLELAVDRRMEFRIGINLGDVIEEADGTIYGDGVNIAARMEALADTGGICISSTIFDAVEGKLDFGFDFLGAQEVKNIDRPISVYRVRTGPGELPEKGSAKAAAVPLRVSVPFLAGVMATGIVLAGVAGWWFIAANEAPQMVTADGTPTDDPVLAIPTGPSIAVLPFENTSDDDGQEHFATGLTEDLIIRLSQFPQLFVIARNSTAQYAGESVDVRTVGRDLGARYVIEGRVRKEANAIRITVLLLDAEDGTHMWGKSYDRDLSVASVFEIQDEITQKVAATIGDAWGVLNRAEIDAIRDKPTENLDGYECVLRTVSYYDRIGPAEHSDIRNCLERAVASDPGYADAWAMLAEIYLDEHRFGFNPLPKPLDRALTAAETALSLDRRVQASLWASADVYFYRHDLAAFAGAAESAIASNPNNSTILAAMGDRFIWAGELERGIALTMKATALNPNHPGWYFYGRFLYHFQKGEDQAALGMALKANMPEHFATHMLQAVGHARLGQIGDARTAADRLLEIYPTYPADARKHLRAWNMGEEHIQRLIESLRKAGLDIPDEPALTN
jgi:adenylate cyclase